MVAGDVTIVRGIDYDATSLHAVYIPGSDDFIQIDTFAATRTTANDTVGTVSGWINVPDITGSYAMWSVGDDNAVENIHFGVEAGKLFGACTDAATVQWDINSTAVVITPYKWHHIVLTQNATRPTFYIDGAAVAMTDTVTTDLTEWFNNLDGVDKGSIGILTMNSTTTLDFKGGIGFVKYANVEWNAAEVLLEFQWRAGQSGRGSSQTRGVTNSWDFDKDLVDSVAGEDGTIVSEAVLDPNYSGFKQKLTDLRSGATDIYSYTIGNNGVECLHVQNT